MSAILKGLVSTQMTLRFFSNILETQPQKTGPTGKSQPFAAARLVANLPPGFPPVHISVGAWPSTLRIRVRHRPHVQVEALMGRGGGLDGWNYGALPYKWPSINGDYWGVITFL